MVLRASYGAFTYPVSEALLSFGIRTRLMPDGSPESMAGSAIAGITTGVLSLGSGPVRWINIQASISGTDGRPDMFSLLYGILDKRISPAMQKIEIRRSRGRTKQGVSEWVSKVGGRNSAASEFAHSIASVLNSDPGLSSDLRRWGKGIQIHADPVVDSWVIAVGAGKRIESVIPTYEQWTILERITGHIRKSALPAGLGGTRLSAEGRARADEYARQDEADWGDAGVLPVHPSVGSGAGRIGPSNAGPEPAKSKPKSTVSIPDEIEAAFSGYFIHLKGEGWDPNWVWKGGTWSKYPEETVNNDFGGIVCKSGPIGSVMFSAVTEVTDEETPHEQASYAVEWRVTNEVVFTVEPEWLKTPLPGIHHLSLRKVSGPGEGWMGNDMGLGLIDELNESGRAAGWATALSVDVTPADGLQPIEFEEGDLHSVIDAQIVIGYPQNSQVYTRNSTRPLVWQSPSSRSWNALSGIAETVVETPRHMPAAAARDSEMVRVPAPKINYLKWLFLFIATLAFTAGALAAFNFDWDGRPVGWTVFGGVVLSLVSIVLWFASLGWLGEIMGGCLEVTGPVERKWQVRSHFRRSYLDSVDAHDYVRVRGRPFMVSRKMYSSVHEGDRITVMFWPNSKNVERWRAGGGGTRYSYTSVS